MLDYINIINQRVSYHAHELTAPAPSPDDLMTILSTVTSAPDHGHLCPWHILIITPERMDNFCDQMLQHWQAHHPEEGKTGHAKRLLNYIRQAPMMILVSAKVTPNHPVCESDQVFAAAAACQNILLASHQLGYGAIWYSTDVVQDAKLKSLFGLTAADQPVGFIMLGSIVKTKQIKRPEVASFCHYW
ncbi:nitroreductase [Motilimonas sp. KMU-193]|uniref:nitroreductase family protein n=1 Tax=Motilimonas sp. KMU-193 TaxID=3388668 RepID=UPI00396B3978